MELTKTNKGHEKLCYEGHSYTKRRTSKSHICWRCSEVGKHNCSGILFTDLKIKSVLSTTGHNHPADAYKLEALKARVAMKELAVSKMEAPASKIVDDVLNLTSHAVRASMSEQMESVKRYVNRQKQHAVKTSFSTNVVASLNTKRLAVKTAVELTNDEQSNASLLSDCKTSPALTSISPSVNMASESLLTSLTPVEKYKRTKRLCVSLALLASQASIIEFIRRYSLLEELQEAWRFNKDVQLAQSVELDGSDQGLDGRKETVESRDLHVIDSVMDAKTDNENCDVVPLEDDEDEEGKFTDLLLSSKLELVSEDDDAATDMDDLSVVINNDNVDSKSSIDMVAPRFSCHLCEAVLNRSRALMSHIRRHNQIQCKQCDKQLSSEKRLRQHELTHKKQLNADGTKQRFQCELCKRSLCDRRGLATHMRSHNGERPYVCSTCGRAFGAPHTLRLHMRLHTGVRPHKCPYCEKTFAQSSSLLRHKRTHTGEKLWACEVCHKDFCDQSALIRHRNRFHPGLHKKSFRGPRPASDMPKSFVCTLCNKSMKSQRSLDDHMNMHTNERPYKCDQCPQAFHDYSTLHKHIVRHTGALDYVCNVCGTAFHFATALTSHMRSHSDVRPYTCEVCSKSFKSRPVLRVHTRMHTGERPYSCETCGYTFRDHSSMIRHRHTHTGYRPHVCAKCGKGFKDTSALAMHMRIHTGDRPCQCTLCPMKFAMRNTLKKHLRCMHTCAVCNERMHTDVLKEHRAEHAANGEVPSTTEELNVQPFVRSGRPNLVMENYVEQDIASVEDRIKYEVEQLINVQLSAT